MLFLSNVLEVLMAVSAVFYDGSRENWPDATGFTESDDPRTAVLLDDAGFKVAVVRKFRSLTIHG